MASRTILTLAGVLFALSTECAWPEVLDALQGGWPSLGLKASIAAPATPEVEQGSDLQLRLSADLTASVMVALEDENHRVRLHVIKRQDTGDQLVPGTEMLYPDLAFGETLYADLPVGKATIWVIASDKTLFSPDSTSTSGTRIWDVAALNQQIADARNQGGIIHLTVQRIPIDVIAPAVKEFVSKADFVSFYAVRTRGVKDADRGFRIGFKKNSAELDDWSRRQLQAVGQGMQDPQLANFRFEIDGHTDDTGTADYNMDLSVRRANAVHDFLARATGVSSNRLKTEGFGKSRPAVPGNDEAAREQNRRVVIKRLDDAKP